MNTKLVIGVVAIGGIFLLVALMSGNKDDAVVTQGGTQTETTVTIPANMPANVPMYPGAVLTAVQENDSAGERNISLTLATPDTVADVNKWYRGALAQNGWAVTDDKNVGGYVLLKGENGNLTVFMQAANGEGGAVITQRIRIRD